MHSGKYAPGHILRNEKYASRLYFPECKIGCVESWDYSHKSQVITDAILRILNSFGTLFRLTTFGESHGAMIGGVIDGVPSGIKIDPERVQMMLDRRRPGNSFQVSQRQEKDKVQFLSGLLNNVTLGTPIGFTIPNSDAHSRDYDELKDVYRPGTADYPYQQKYGLRDHRGGGRASARETACRMVAGAIALQILEHQGVTIHAQLLYPTSEQIEQVRLQGDSLGGMVQCMITGLPAGVGEPIYDKLSSRLAAAMMSINAAKSFEIGDGVELSRMKGSEVIDSDPHAEQPNHNGGILGGISTGAPVIMRVGFKPTPSIAIEQKALNTDLQPVKLKIKGRHDPCVAVRAVPVVEAMAAITCLDLMLINNAYHTLPRGNER